MAAKTEIEFPNKKNIIVDIVYPIGSIYISINNTNPSTLFGGTWVAWGSGRVPVGVNTEDTKFNTVEKTGGALTHTHTGPSHTHTTGDCTLDSTMIPSHSHTMSSHKHSIPALSGSAASAGSHSHKVTSSGLNKYANNSAGSNVLTLVDGQNMFGTTSAGAHTHTVSTTASETGTNNSATSSTGGGKAHNHGSTGSAGTGATGSTSTLQPYITCYMWKRTA